jgi:hypothetical protein
MKREADSDWRIVGACMRVLVRKDRDYLTAPLDRLLAIR